MRGVAYTLTRHRSATRVHDTVTLRELACTLDNVAALAPNRVKSTAAASRFARRRRRPEARHAPDSIGCRHLDDDFTEPRRRGRQFRRDADLQPVRFRRPRGRRSPTPLFVSRAAIPTLRPCFPATISSPPVRRATPFESSRAVRRRRVASRSPLTSTVRHSAASCRLVPSPVSASPRSVRTSPRCAAATVASRRWRSRRRRRRRCSSRCPRTIPSYSARCRLVQLFSSSGAATVPTTVTDRHEHPVESCGHQRRGGHHWIGVVRERHVDHAVRGQRPRRDLVGCLFQRRQQDKDVHVHDRCCRVGDGERAVAASASTTEGRAWRRNVSGQSPPASPGGRRAATASESTTQRAAEPTNHRRRDTTESALRFSTHADRLAPVERREGEPRANP